MPKIIQPSSPVVNVVAGQTATLDLNPGPRYHAVQLVATCRKTGTTPQPALSDVLGLINVKVNTVSRRQHLASELDGIQTRWGSDLAVAKYDQIGNDLISTVADSGSGSTATRTTTFVFTVWFAEPFRDQYAARDAYAWPTLWKSGRRISLQMEIGVPNNAGIDNIVIRANEVLDYNLGPVDSKGNDIMPITHWFRQPETYGGTAVTIRKWPFNGIIYQMSILNNSPDFVDTLEIKGDGVTKFKAQKRAIDTLSTGYNFNPSGVGASQFDLAFDFTDNPQDGLDMTAFNALEANLTLDAATASNKTLIFLTQVYQDALA